jgi:multidrug resistance efflux pump
MACLALWSGQAFAQAVTLGALVSGQVVMQKVKAGQRVKKGQLLMVIDPARWKANKLHLEAVLLQQQAELEEIKRDWIEAKDLYDRAVLPKREWQRTQTRLTIAQAQVDAARARLKAHVALQKYFYIRAPFAGKVKEIWAPLGSTVYQENTPLLKLEPEE